MCIVLHVEESNWGTMSLVPPRLFRSRQSWTMGQSRGKGHNGDYKLWPYAERILCCVEFDAHGNGSFRTYALFGLIYNFAPTRWPSDQSLRDLSNARRESREFCFSTTRSVDSEFHVEDYKERWEQLLGGIKRNFSVDKKLYSSFVEDNF